MDDGKLEVVAIFGSMQMAVSRLVNMNHHRITQVSEGWADEKGRKCLASAQGCAVSLAITWM